MKVDAPAKQLYEVENGDAKGDAIVDAAGDVKDAGRVEIEGGVVKEEGTVFVDSKVGLGAAGAGEEVLAAGEDVDDTAAAAMVPIRSQGFGGETIVQI